MSRSLISPARAVPLRVRPYRLLAVALAAVVAAAIAFSGDDPVTPVKPNATPDPPLIFGDPSVAKGARGAKADRSTLEVFGDPTVRKGAAGLK